MQTDRSVLLIRWNNYASHWAKIRTVVRSVIGAHSFCASTARHLCARNTFWTLSVSTKKCLKDCDFWNEIIAEIFWFLWNILQSFYIWMSVALNNSHRTNNAPEAWHNRFQVCSCLASYVRLIEILQVCWYVSLMLVMVGKSHPTIFNLKKISHGGGRRERHVCRTRWGTKHQAAAASET